MVQAIEVEVDTPNDCNLFFPPLQRSIRGRLDFRRLAYRNPNALAFDMKYGTIPGEAIGIDRDGKVYVRELLHDRANERVAKKIRDAGYRLNDERTDFEGVDVMKCLRYIMLAVKSGAAKILKGTLPAELPDDPDCRPPSDVRDEQINTLVASVTKLADTVEKLVRKHGV